jgi:hypothetical protein
MDSMTVKRAAVMGAGHQRAHARGLCESPPVSPASRHDLARVGRLRNRDRAETILFSCHVRA